MQGGGDNSGKGVIAHWAQVRTLAAIVVAWAIAVPDAARATCHEG
jgi:hypothetical protein